ncbi:MAG: RHS repeat domain-containing protein, partial [Terriglobales bacterium]
GPSSTALTFDANGNMTSDGNGNSFAFDAENRMTRITYPGTNNFTDFTFDGLGRWAKIVETTAGSVTSTRQFVWSFGTKPKESRDGSSIIVSQYFSRGQMDTTTTKRPYCRNHLGSVTEVTDNTGAIQGQQSFDSFGRATQLQGSYLPDFGYAGYYLHARSGLNLTLTRAYSPVLGRWINRDRIEEAGGSNLFAYVGNRPVSVADPSGLIGPIDILPPKGILEPDFPEPPVGSEVPAITLPIPGDMIIVPPGSFPAGFPDVPYFFPPILTPIFCQGRRLPNLSPVYGAPVFAPYPAQSPPPGVDLSPITLPDLSPITLPQEPNGPGPFHR